MMGALTPRFTQGLCMCLIAILAGILAVPADSRCSEIKTNEPATVLDAFVKDTAEPGSVTLAIVLDREVQTRIYPMHDPSRLVVDLMRTEGRNLPPQIPLEDERLARRIRAWAHPDKGFVRFVFDLQEDRKYQVNPCMLLPEEDMGKITLEITVQQDQ